LQGETDIGGVVFIQRAKKPKYRGREKA